MMAVIALLLAATNPDVPVPSPRAVVSAMFETFNRHDAVGLAKLYAADARLTSPDFCSPRGQRDVERTYAALFAAYPDIRDEVQEMVVEGDIVAVRFVATSKAGKLNLPIQTMLRVREGRIVSDDSLFDAGGAQCQP